MFWFNLVSEFGFLHFTRRFTISMQFVVQDIIEHHTRDVWGSVYAWKKSNSKTLSEFNGRFQLTIATSYVCLTDEFFHTYARLGQDGKKELLAIVGVGVGLFTDRCLCGQNNEVQFCSCSKLQALNRLLCRKTSEAKKLHAYTPRLWN